MFLAAIYSFLAANDSLSAAAFQRFLFSVTMSGRSAADSSQSKYLAGRPADLAFVSNNATTRQPSANPATLNKTNEIRR